MSYPWMPIERLLNNNFGADLSPRDSLVVARYADGTEAQWFLGSLKDSVRHGNHRIPVEFRLVDSTYAGGKTNPTAPELLAKAKKHMDDRAATYDKPEGERSMAATVAAFNAITGRDLTESEGWLIMQILKDVRDRQRGKPHVDSLEDGIAYAALKAEARMKGL